MTSLTNMPADIVEAGRAVVADVYAEQSAHEEVERILAGKRDHWSEVEVACRAIVADRQGDQWQPIETAPKDGTEILGVFSRDYGYQEKPTVYGPYTVRFRDGKWVSSWDGSEVIRSQTDFGTEYEDVMDPTHWQPIPAPPAKGS